MAERRPSAAERQARALEAIERLLSMSLAERREETLRRGRSRVGSFREQIAETREERWLMFLHAAPQMMSEMHRMPEERFAIGAAGATIECRCGLRPIVEDEHHCSCGRLYIVLGGRVYVTVVGKDEPEPAATA